MTYKIPDSTRIGHVHLKVADLERSLSFYGELLGFQITQQNSAGLFHTAILYPERKDLATILKRLLDAGYPLTGASDHGVSEALYLDDPDGNGVELYWDKPKEEWPIDGEGNLMMTTDKLDLEELLSTVS